MTFNKKYRSIFPKSAGENDKKLGNYGANFCQQLKKEFNPLPMKLLIVNENMQSVRTFRLSTKAALKFLSSAYRTIIMDRGGSAIE